jgi:hypothetical protein
VSDGPKYPRCTIDSTEMISFLIVAALAAAPAKKHPEPDTIPPAGAQIVIHVSKEEFPRAKDECDLANLLREDLENTGKGMVNLNVRARINAIMKRLPKEQ